MLPFRPESSTLPSGFRFHHNERPTTPEPRAEIEQPLPPRQPKIKLRRRNVLDYSFDAPSDLGPLFPVPTIEIATQHTEANEENHDIASQPAAGFLAPQRRSSPPKTPVPQMFNPMEQYDRKRPDWSMGTESPEERPTSAMSNPSEWSDESFFSSIRTSRTSEDGCTSPEDDERDVFVFPPIKGKRAFTRGPVPFLNSSLRSKTSPHVHWSKDMSAHLWQTYQIYLQDSTVTPFRIGESGVPPEGVVIRVAREAKRSWTGPKTAKNTLDRGAMRSLTSVPSIDDKTISNTDSSLRSGSNTPTSETTPSGLSLWPHSSVATRNHLRELCRKDNLSVHAHRYLQASSTTPKAHFRAHSTGHNNRFADAFSTKDFALSLTTSTADSMRPDGPLAQLTSSHPPQSAVPRPASSDGANDDPFIDRSALFQPRPLASPFVTRSYGPSSSQTLASFGRPSPPRHTRSTDAPRLRSPVHFSPNPRSLNGTGKRRAPNPLEEELATSNGGITRPSILDDQLFGGPLDSNKRRVRNRGFSLGDDALAGRLPPAFVLPMLGLHNINGEEKSKQFGSAPQSLLPSAMFENPLLTPGLSEGANQTFPRRFLQPSVEIQGSIGSGSGRIGRRQYNTVHHPRRSIESFDFGSGSGGLSLQTRLEKLDEKLAEIRAREEKGRGAERRDVV